MDIEGLHGFGETDQQKVTKAQQLIDDIVHSDTSTVALITRVTALVATAKEQGINTDAYSKQLQTVALNVAARQAKIKSKAGDGSLLIKLANVPNVAKEFVKDTVASIKSAGQSVWNWISSPFEGLGEPVTITLGTIVVGAIVVGAVAAAALYLIFGPDLDKSKADAKKISELNNFLETEVQSGSITRAKADAIYSSVNAFGDELYQAGQRKQWWKTAKGLVITGTVVVSAGAAILYAVPKLKKM